MPGANGSPLSPGVVVETVDGNLSKGMRQF